MSILTRIKRLLGLDESRSPTSEQPAAVTVEREPDEEQPTIDPEPEASEVSEPSPETKSEESAVEETEPEPITEETSSEDGADESVTSINGIGPTYADRLADAGIDTVSGLASADPEELAESTEIAESRLVRWVETAQQRTSG